MELLTNRFLVLLCLGASVQCTSAEDNTSASNVEYIHVTGLFPLSRKEGEIGRGVLPAVKLALQHVNDSDKVLRGYELKTIDIDTECDMAKGMKAFFDSLATGPPTYMVFGGACQAVTEPIAEAVHFWKLVQLSYGATTPALSEREKYPYFFRTVPSEMDIGSARLRLFMYFNWTTISTIHQDISRFFYAQNQQVKMMEDNGINILTEAVFADDPTPAITKLKDVKARIIVGFFDENMARKVICKAFNEGMYETTHVWLLPGWFQPDWWRSGDESDGCSQRDLQQALQGYISTDLLPLSGSDEPTESGYTPQEYEKMYNELRGNEYSTFHGYAYDGVWVMARALDSVLQALRYRGELARFQGFNYSDDVLLEMFSKAMNDTNFRGVTGIVQFRGGERLGSTVHKQLQGQELEKVAEYYAITDSLNLSSGRGFEWPGGGDKPPRDTQMTEYEQLSVSLALFGGMSAIAIAGIIMAFGFLFFNMRYRNQRYIKMSSPFLNNFIIMGGILTYVSVVLLGIDHGISLHSKAYKAICTSRAWFLCLGFTLAFGAMFSKTWRVHRIFTNIKMKKKVIKDGQLMAIVGFMAVIDLIILVVWQIVDPMKPTSLELSSRMDTSGRDVMIIPVMETCVSANMTIWLAVIYIYKGVLMIFGLFLAWETRHVSIPALNDSKYIGSSVYNVVIMCVLGVALSSVIKDNPNASYGLVSVFILFCSTVTLCLVFVPKVIEMRGNPNVNERVRVVGTMDKSRSASTSINTFDTDQKFKSLCSEKRELKSKLDEQNEMIKELEKQLFAIAPDEVPLLLQEEEQEGRSSGVDTPNSTCYSTKSQRTDTSKVCASPGSVRFCVTEPTSSDQSQNTPSKSRWEAPQEFAPDAGDKSSLYPLAFGGVYIGPPVTPITKPSSTPPARPSIPSSNSAPVSFNSHAVTQEPVSKSNNASLERIAQVHRPFNDSSDDVTPDGSSEDRSNNNTPPELGISYSFKSAPNEETSFVSLTRNLLD
ncbi:gamma-aminobutyric acid type B receptor subunit 2-like isoform X2 [Acanthaster planci]|uniref:Gamma-aminobutyric acid type B receptor subunit 2 n=1 Tax=Acanthaster planci TaxID=133434 RepID=A0A8B7YNH8_ACAPL|nr:gamma-aminobutyric acid type B receptor subunit 2-like isoform X2 [Acanthaster planci]